MLGKGANLDGRYILKTRSDEKPADACVNGCIYYKGNHPKILDIEMHKCIKCINISFRGKA